MSAANAFVPDCWGRTAYERRWADMPYIVDNRYRYELFQLDAAITHFMEGRTDVFRSRTVGWMVPA